jgi:hypothetical protein
LRAPPFLKTQRIISHGSPRLDSEDRLSGLIRKGAETGWGMFGLMEIIRLKYSQTDVAKDFLNI